MSFLVQGVFSSSSRTGCLILATVFQNELSNIRTLLLERFEPDDAYPLGIPVYMETPHPCSPLAQIEFETFDEVVEEPPCVF